MHAFVMCISPSTAYKRFRNEVEIITIGFDLCKKNLKRWGETVHPRSSFYVFSSFEKKSIIMGSSVDTILVTIIKKFHTENTLTWSAKAR